MSKFKNINGVLFLKELFWELAGNKDNALYTLKDEDHEVNGVLYPSLYRLYMEANDITEYQFALRHLHSWEHWKSLASAPFFQPYVAKWREELEVRQRSEALAKILQASKGSTRDSFVAAKYIAEGWDKPSKGRGRPSKQEIMTAAKDLAEDKSRVEKDYLRLVTND